METNRVTLHYTGQATDLVGRVIMGVILTLMTVGIYAPWFINGLYRYIIEHIHLEIPSHTLAPAQASMQTSAPSLPVAACPNCAASINPEATFCTKCGASLA